MEGTNRECRQRTPAGVALVSEGRSARKPNRLDGRGKKRTPPEFKSPAGLVVDWTDEPYSDPRLSPRACLGPAGRFHRGATRGELDGIVSGSVEEANT